MGDLATCLGPCTVFTLQAPHITTLQRVVMLFSLLDPPTGTSHASKEIVRARENLGLEVDRLKSLMDTSNMLGMSLSQL